MSEEQGRLKITVLKVFKPEEVFEDSPFKAMEHEPCEIHREGQVFYFEENQPEGFCNYAWNAIFPYVTTLSWGGDFKSVYKEPGVAVIACPDGLRPVIFKLELEK